MCPIFPNTSGGSQPNQQRIAIWGTTHNSTLSWARSHYSAIRLLTVVTWKVPLLRGFEFQFSISGENMSKKRGIKHVKHVLSVLCCTCSNCHSQCQAGPCHPVDLIAGDLPPRLPGRWGATSGGNLGDSTADSTATEINA